MAAELEVVEKKQRAEDQAIIKALEKELEEFSGGFPYYWVRHHRAHPGWFSDGGWRGFTGPASD